jgi:hypothetical protein
VKSPFPPGVLPVRSCFGYQTENGFQLSSFQFFTSNVGKKGFLLAEQIWFSLHSYRSSELAVD